MTKRLLTTLLLLLLCGAATRAQDAGAPLPNDGTAAPSPTPAEGADVTAARSEEFADSLTARARVVALLQFNSKLSVFAPLAADPVTCAAGYKGVAYFNTVSGASKVCNGSAWQTVTTSAASLPASAAQGDLIYGSATNVYSNLAKSATATRYLSNTGTSNNPAWAQVDLSNGVTGTLPIANGGTGQTSAANAINALLPSQTSNSGKYLTTNGSVASWGTVTAGITNAAGANVIPKSDGTNLVASQISDDGIVIRLGGLGNGFVKTNDDDGSLSIDSSSYIPNSTGTGTVNIKTSTSEFLAGDTDSSGNLTVLSVNDASQKISLQANSIGARCTVTPSGTTGAQTINQACGSVNFAAAATSLVVTNATVSTFSVITCTVGTNDATLKSAQCVAGTGSFTMYSNAAAAAETRINFWILNP